MKRLVRSQIIAIAALLLSGCMHTIRPGAVDRIDSKAFDIIGSAEKSIESLKRDCPDGHTSPCPQSKKDALNVLIRAHNVALRAATAYHDTVKAGRSGDREGLSRALADLILAGDNFRKVFP